jgi:hypothetical protein
MKARLVYAALAATVLVFQSMPVRATCIIAPDGKSINVVTDNGSSDEKSCQVSCKVDTKIGVVSVSCGGNTPPLAKDHSLCAFDKTEVWYKKVVSSEDSCKGGAAGAAPAVVAPAADAKADGFTCRISPDGKTVDAMIANPYKGENRLPNGLQGVDHQGGHHHECVLREAGSTRRRPSRFMQP